MGDESRRMKGLSVGDIPNIEVFRARLMSFQTISQMPAWSGREVAKLNRIIDVEVPELIAEVGGVSTPQMSCREEPSPSRFGLFRFLPFGGASAERDAKRRKLSADK